MARSTKSGLKSWEYPKKSGIGIREIINSSGAESFGGSFLVTVPSRLTGALRVRRQFKLRSDAEAWADEQWRGARSNGESFFSLSDEERREVLALVPKLKEQRVSVSEAIRFSLKHLKPESKTKTVNTIVAELVASKEQRLERGDLRERSVRDFRHRAERFDLGFAGRIASEVSADEIKAWLRSLGKRSPRTTKNDLAVIGEIFRFATQKRYVSFSPLDELTDVDRKEICGNDSEVKEPGILTAAEAEMLLRAAHSNPDFGLLAAVTLGLFCGLRTEELKRLTWADIRMDECPPFVTVGAAIAKKRRIRHVEVPANAMQWLTLISDREGPIAPNRHFNDFQKRFRKLLKAAGISDWNQNAMRHSFGSYHYALHGNPLETARLLGHKADDQVLFDHYRALATKDQAKRFYSIAPKTRAHH